MAIGVATAFLTGGVGVSVIDLRCRPQPAIPIELSGNLGNRNWRTRRRSTDRGLNVVNLAESTLGDQRHRFDKQVESASLLGTHLDDATGLFLYLANQLAFVDRQCKWLFAVDVFAGQHRFDERFGVPMVRSGDVKDIDVIPLDYFAIVFISLRLTVD